MGEEKIQELLKKLFSLEYTFKGVHGDYSRNIIDKECVITVENFLRNYFINNKDEELSILKHKLGFLEAKVFAYEKIISNSNFAPFVFKEEEQIEVQEKKQNK